MDKNLRKVKTYLGVLEKNRKTNLRRVENIKILPCGYKENNILPTVDKFLDFTYGEKWGSIDGHAWFHFSVETEFENSYLFVRTEFSGWDATKPQFILYINGKMIQGLDINHLEALLPKGKSDIYLYGYTGFEISNAQFYADIYELDEDVNDLYYDVKYPYDVLSFADEESEQYAKILSYLSKTVSFLDLYDIPSKEFSQSVQQAKKYIREEYYGKYCREQVATVACIGHTHIDCAWLWTLEQTKEKVQRSFSTVLELMKRYPDYKFMSSQALLYKYFKEEAPEKYEELKQRVKEGRWEVEGAMWVEADCNLSSGESLIRQIIKGKKFFKDEFGVESKILWLPDVFGYSAALPQILNKCGVEWFITSKISWNDTNRMPYDTFLWQGIDGSKIKSYFLTAQNDTGKPSVNYSYYNGETNAKMISGTYKRYQQKNLSDEVLLTFGHGDGGGGPSILQLEYLKRAKNGVPSLPNARCKFAWEFLSGLAKKIQDNPEVPKWQGELYLEYHRGTYTTQVNNKKNNRKCEFLLQNAEFMSTIAKNLFGYEYPTEKLETAWEKLLINQFHDIIPGSSIKQVYERSDKDYAEIYQEIGYVLQKSCELIAKKVSQNQYVVFNPTSFGGKKLVNLDGKTVIAQDIAEKGYSIIENYVDTNNIVVNGNVVETQVYRVEFNDSYEIVSIIDKLNGREVLSGKGNEFRLYADYTDLYDAWEWQEHSLDKYKVINDVKSVTIVDDGARKGIKLVRNFSYSTIVQTIWFYDELNRIDFETEIDWNEKHNMLKVAFPIDVNTDKATYEIQYGNVERPTHFNTSWDRARFEVCAQKYVDLSDKGYGVSIINDCKYGYDVHDGVMQLSILRAPDYPDKKADIGVSSFVYSLSTHKGALENGNTLQHAYEINNPCFAVKGLAEKTLITDYSFVKTNCDNVLCEVVKEADDGTGIVVRLYESMNIKTNCVLSFGSNYKKVYFCNMLEEEQTELEMIDNSINYLFKGFEIITLKLKTK